MTDFEPVHDRLREILMRQRGDLAVTKDGLRERDTLVRDTMHAAGVPVCVTLAGGYAEDVRVALEIPGLEGKPWGYVAGTRVGKGYVSYYLMPIYVSPDLAATISAELAKRRQGKACFNFTKIDEPLFAELEAFTATSISGFRAIAEGLAATRR